MAKLDLDWIRVFVEVYKTRSVSRAAQHLGMAQAGASIALNKLRHHFDDRLFTRTSLGMEPTPHAERIYPELNEALRHLERARGKAEAFLPAEATRSFRVCMTDISEMVLLPSLIDHLQQVAPGVSLEVEKITADSRRQLESGDVDLAVGFMPDMEAGFYQQALFGQRYACLAAATHPRVQGTLSRQALAREGHIVITTSGTGHAIVDKVLARHKLERRVVLRVPSFLGVARIVAQTELLAVVPGLLADVLIVQEPVQRLEMPVPLPAYKIKQHWHERFNADSGNVWLRQTVATLFGGGGAALRWSGAT